MLFIQVVAKRRIFHFLGQKILQNHLTHLAILLLNRDLVVDFNRSVLVHLQAFTNNLHFTHPPLLLRVVLAHCYDRINKQ